MTTPVIVEPEHLQRAYAQLRKPGWPSLEQLREAYAHYGMVRARAVALANGQTLPPEPTAAPPAPPPAPAPASSIGLKPEPWPFPARRRTDADAHSGRMAAAGEYAHPPES